MTEFLDLIVAENRRLLKEVKVLRARVAAFEASRWWRLHPRRVFGWRPDGRLVSGRHQVEHLPPNRSTASANHPLVDRFYREVVEVGSFRKDMFTWAMPSWEPFIAQFEGRPARVLEIGSFEGMSASYFLWRLPQAHVTCIDTFAGSPEHPTLGIDTSNLRAEFERNVSLVDASRVRTLVGTSNLFLAKLLDEGSGFDIVYVDGSHMALDVLVDAALAWQLLAPGGIVIFDDYRWTVLGEGSMLRPGPAIDAFLALVAEEREILLEDLQVIVRKRSPTEGRLSEAPASSGDAS